MLRSRTKIRNSLQEERALSLTITLPEPLATRLQKHSALLQRPVAEVASTLLEGALPDTAPNTTIEATDFPFMPNKSWRAFKLRRLTRR
jgi:hypothetical protein